MSQVTRIEKAYRVRLDSGQLRCVFARVGGKISLDTRDRDGKPVILELEKLSFSDLILVTKVLAELLPEYDGAPWGNDSMSGRANECLTCYGTGKEKA